jgi:hypothetical protein
MPIDNPYQHGYEKYSYTPIFEFRNGQRIMYPWQSQRWMSCITFPILPTVYQLQKQYKNYLSNGSSPATRSVSRCCQGSSSTLIMLKYHLIKWFLEDALYSYEDR